MIYVGPLVTPTSRTPRAVRARGRAARMIADDVDELVECARMLGLDKGPLRRRPWPHYWLTPPMRLLAIRKFKARELSATELGQRARTLYSGQVRRKLL